MKALSIRQPWAELIVRGYKPVENRTWATRYRGPVLIHSGQTFDADGMDWVRANRERLGLPADWLTWPTDVGGIVGAARITDCVTRHDSPWFFGPRGFVLEDAQPLPFLPRRGHLGLFEVEVAPSYAEIAAMTREQQREHVMAGLGLVRTRWITMQEAKALFPDAEDAP